MIVLGCGCTIDGDAARLQPLFYGTARPAFQGVVKKGEEGAGGFDLKFFRHERVRSLEVTPSKGVVDS